MRAVCHFIARNFSIIVLALTNVGFGLAILGFAAVMLGCGPAAIHVAPSAAMTFQEILDADTRADARRPAHWMADTVRGAAPRKDAGVLRDEKLPEAYTLNGEQGSWPSQYHLGYAALRLIREHYASAHAGYQKLESEDLVEVVDEAGGNTYMVHDFDRDWQLDIADVKKRFVFEVVPPGQAHQQAGKKKAEWRLMLLNNAMLGVPEFTLGARYSGEIGVRFAENGVPWKLSWTTELGVVQYEWHVLSAEGASDDAHNRAYLEDRWHTPTTNEVRRFGRVLHEMVERLVQAREALGQTRAATTMPLLPGKTIVDYLRSVRLWSTHDDPIARLLPVMREPPPPPPPVRRNARFAGQTVGGGGSGGPQGGYTVKGRPGNMPWRLFMGHSAHNVIGTHYETRHGKQNVRVNKVSILSIIPDAGGDKALVRADEALLKPDLTHLRKRVVFEIKSPLKGQLEEGKKDVAMYITALNRAMPPDKPFTHGVEFSGDLWIRFTLTMPYWRLTWSTTAPGVIQYKWNKLNSDQVDEAEILKGIQEGRYSWVDLTEADLEQYAEKCAEFSELYANGADKLYKMQLVTDFVVGIIGDAAIVYLSPGLGLGKTAQKAAQPSTRVPASPPPVNARSLGSDGPATFSGSVHPTPRPAAPGKTPSGPTNVSPN